MLDSGPIRSKKYRDGAKGAPCTLRIVGVCCGDAETTVFAHIRDRHTGKAQKASDLSGADACWRCHDVLDRRAKMPDGKYISDEDWHRYALRGIQETLENRIARGIIVVPQDVAPRFHDRPVKARKPKDQRGKVANGSRPIAQHVNPWPPKGQQEDSDTAEDERMNLVDALNAPAAIVGTTGAGKTFAAKGAVEELLSLGRRVVIIDPTGAWWGLRSGADGNPEGGFPVTIFGGDHGDIPLTDTAGARLAEAIAGREVQAIVDVSEMTGGEKTRFLTDFLQTLYAKNRAALHLVVDEADEIAPQNPMPEERRLSGAFDKIVRRGRIKGFRPLMITQRPAVLHKNVLSQIGTLIALKLTSPQDRKAIDDWVKGNADTSMAAKVMPSLPKLPRGEGWLWSPAAGVLELREFPPIRTFDSSRTPGADEAVVEPPLSSVDVEQLREAMQAEPEPATTGKKASASDLTAAEERGYQRGLAEGIERGKVTGIALGIQRVRAAIDALRVDDVAAGEIAPRGEAISVPAAPIAPAPRKAAQRSPEPPRKANGNDPLLAAALSIWPARGTWGMLASMCGRKARGGHFNTARKALIEGGLVRMDGELVTPTDPPAMPEGAIPADLLEQNLPQPAAKMFAAIRAKPGITIIGLATVLGMQPRGGHWNTGMSTLRRNGLIEERGDALSIPSTLLGGTDA